MPSQSGAPRENFMEFKKKHMSSNAAYLWSKCTAVDNPYVLTSLWICLASITFHDIPNLPPLLAATRQNQA